jgi:hypothetical protein
MVVDITDIVESSIKNHNPCPSITITIPFLGVENYISTFYSNAAYAKL